MMNIEDLTIKQVKEVQNLFSPQPKQSTNDSIYAQFIGEVCVIRTYSAGVHIGTVQQFGANGKNVLLTNARRLWQWSGAFTLSEVAQKGINSESRLSDSVPFILLTESIEVIPTSQEARETYDKCSN